MGAISRPHDYTTGVVDADECNDNEDLLYNTINGGLDAANIAANSITDAKMETAVKPVTRDAENFQDRVYAGCSVSTGGSSAPLVATVAGGTAYVKGVRVTPTAASHTCATNATTYLDLSSSGVYSWNSNAGAASDSVRLYTIVTDALGITPAPTDGRTFCPVGAINIEDNACTDIASANETTATGIVTTNTVSATIISQTIPVLGGDRLDIHGKTSLAASTTCTPKVSVYVDGDLKYPVSAPNLTSTLNQAIPFDVHHSVSTTNTALAVVLTLAAQATTSTATAKNSIVTIIRHRR